MITMNIQNLGDDAASPSSPPACGEELKAAKQKLKLRDSFQRPHTCIP